MPERLDRFVHRLILFYLLVVGLVYVLGIGLLGNIEGLRVLHQDIPAWASDATFQVKVLANLSAGIIFVVSCAGLILRRPWATSIATPDARLMLAITPKLPEGMRNAVLNRMAGLQAPVANTR